MAGRAGRWAGRWRTRTAVLGVLLLGLGVATALVLVRGAPGDGAIPAARPERAAEIGARDSGLPDRPSGTSPGAVLGAPCRPEPGWPGWWRCQVAGIGVSARSVRPDAAAGLYTRLAGPVGKPATGPAVCAAGRPEERAWSRPAAPARPVGRYRCRIDGRRAVIWWTDPSGLVARAVAPDADLGRLFGWWTRHAGV